jgi:hypothetical protein
MNRITGRTPHVIAIIAIIIERITTTRERNRASNSRNPRPIIFIRQTKM